MDHPHQVPTQFHPHIPGAPGGPRLVLFMDPFNDVKLTPLGPWMCFVLSWIYFTSRFIVSDCIHIQSKRGFDQLKCWGLRHRKWDTAKPTMEDATWQCMSQKVPVTTSWKATWAGFLWQMSDQQHYLNLLKSSNFGSNTSFQRTISLEGLWLVPQLQPGETQETQASNGNLYGS